MSTHTLTPIGFIRCPKQVKFQAGHQPLPGDRDENLLELEPGLRYDEALRDLAGFERIWLLWWFHRNPNWRPQVIPPRGPQRRRGVFATRSPHRPNALGLTPVTLLRIEGLRLVLGPCDLVDGTPVFDIKPYIPAYDSFPDSRAGWIDEVEREMALPPSHELQVSPLAREQSDWLRREWSVELLERASELLARDPAPNRTRRITRRADGGLVLGCGAWRVRFRVEGTRVDIEDLLPGYPLTYLTRAGYEQIPWREAQLAFHARWPDPEWSVVRPG